MEARENHRSDIISGNLNSAGYVSYRHSYCFRTISSSNRISLDLTLSSSLRRHRSNHQFKCRYGLLSPDLSPIELLRDEIWRSDHEAQPKPATDLRTIVQRLVNEWNAVPQTEMQDLVKRVQNRLRTRNCVWGSVMVTHSPFYLLIKMTSVGVFVFFAANISWLIQTLRNWQKDNNTIIIDNKVNFYVQIIWMLEW